MINIMIYHKLQLVTKHINSYPNILCDYDFDERKDDRFLKKESKKELSI